MILTIAIVSSAFLLTMVMLVGCCFLRKRMRGHQQRSSYTEYSDQEPFEYSDQEPFVDNYQQGQQQRGSMDLNLASPDDEMMGNDTRDFGGEIHQCNNTAGLDITTQQTHTPPPTLRTVAFCEDYNITPQDQGGYTPLCIRGTSEPFTTSSSLPASPSPFHRMKSFSVTGCSPRLFPRPKLQHNSVSEDCNQNETADLQSFCDSVYQEKSIFDSFSKLKDIYDYQSSKYAVNGDLIIDNSHDNHDTSDTVDNEDSNAVPSTAAATNNELDLNGDVGDFNDGGFTRIKVLYDKCKDKVPDR